GMRVENRNGIVGAGRRLTARRIDETAATVHLPRREVVPIAARLALVFQRCGYLDGEHSVVAVAASVVNRGVQAGAHRKGAEQTQCARSFSRETFAEKIRVRVRA